MTGSVAETVSETVGPRPRPWDRGSVGVRVGLGFDYRLGYCPGPGYGLGYRPGLGYGPGIPA